MPSVHLIGIVDDDPDVPVALSSLVRSLGYKVECFKSALQLLERSNLSDFFCVISDIHMPHMSGIHLAQSLGDVADGLPVVLMTGRMEPGLEEKAYASGAVSVIAKPFSFDELYDTLERVVKSRNEHI